MITRDEVHGLFRDLLDQISDDTLRNQVIDTWTAGCEQGGWETVEQLESMPFTLLTNTHGINFLQHCRAVTAGALGLADALLANQPSVPYTIDRDYLIAGGLLHDVGKLLEIGRTSVDGEDGYEKSYAGHCLRHPISGTVLAARFGLCDEILNMIACHASEGNGRPQRIETVLIHQADFATFNPLVMLNKGHLISG